MKNNATMKKLCDARMATLMGGDCGTPTETYAVITTCGVLGGQIAAALSGGNPFATWLGAKLGAATCYYVCSYS